MVRSCHRAHALQVSSSHRPRHPHLRAGMTSPSLGRFVRPQALPPVPQLLWRPAVTGLFLNREVIEAVPLGWLLGGGPGEGSVAIPTQVFVPPGGTDAKSEGPK